jgi:RNA polymerase-binding protein DksA
LAGTKRKARPADAAGAKTPTTKASVAKSSSSTGQARTSKAPGGGKERTAKGAPSAKSLPAKRPTAQRADKSLAEEAQKPVVAEQVPTSPLTAKAKAAATGTLKPALPKASNTPARITGPRSGGVPREARPAESEPLEIKKTYLKPEELGEFRRMLLQKRQELVGDVTNLQGEALRTNGQADNGSSMPIHMADLGTDTWEQEFTLGLIEKERLLLREIDEALDRIDEGTYGMCLATGKPITKTRLRAKPWAKHCIEYARKRELGLA